MRVRRLVWPLALLAVLDATAGLGCDTDETADATPTLVTTPPGAPAEPDASPITDTGDDSGTDDDRGEGTVSDTPTPAATPTQNVAPRPPLEAGAVALGAALGGLTFNRAVEVLPYPPGWTNGGGDVLVAEQGGHVFLVSGGRASVFLDMSAAVPHRGNEEGLLSLVTDPAFLDGRPYLYAYYSVVDGERRTRLSRFTVENGQPGDELTLLEVAQPYANHNGGAVRFGSDGMLYLGLGDGGSGGDPDGNGQNLTTLLGSIIRIDVSGASAGEPYAIPPDNPFVLGQGAPEIRAYGPRNPWRMCSCRRSSDT